jgi:hypothetical protein
MILTVASGGAAVPAGGFLFGFVHAEPDSVSISGRIMVGIIFAILTTITGGYPPKNEGLVGDPWNAWPYILGVWGVISGILLGALLQGYIRDLPRNT